MPTPPRRGRRRRAELAALASVLPVLRPGATVPGATAPVVRAPRTGAHRRIVPHRLRRSLRAALVEGMAAEVVTACAGGAVLTGWALHLGFGPATVAILAGLPFAAQVLHLPAAWITRAWGRRRIALGATAAARTAYALLPLALTLSSPAAQRTFLVAVAAGSAVLAVIGNNAWVAWMGYLVPNRVRGRVFGARMAAATLAGSVAALGAGVFLDVAGRHGRTGTALALLAVLAGVAGLVSVLAMARQHDPHGARPEPPYGPGALTAPFRDPVTRGALRYQLVWNGSVGLASSLFALYMLRDMQLGFTATALYGAEVAVARIAAVPLWGRLIDRVGSRTVLMATSLGIALVPGFWLFMGPDLRWLLAFEAIAAGALWGGHALASFHLPMGLGPSHQRPVFVGAFTAAGGGAFFAAALVGGLVAEALPNRVALGGGAVLADLQVLFLVSMVLRFGTALASLRLLSPRREAAGAVGTTRRAPAPTHAGHAAPAAAAGAPRRAA